MFFAKPQFKLARESRAEQNAVMRLEHCALLVSDPVAMADWYVKQLHCKLVRAEGAPGFGRFVSCGPVMIELYKSSAVPTPDYKAVPPQQLHLAFISENLPTDRDRLISAGATLVEDLFQNAAGDELLMLRDPWSLPLQLVKRAVPMV